MELENTLKFCGCTMALFDDGSISHTLKIVTLPFLRRFHSSPDQSNSDMFFAMSSMQKIMFNLLSIFIVDAL